MKSTTKTRKKIIASIYNYIAFNGEKEIIEKSLLENKDLSLTISEFNRILKIIENYKMLENKLVANIPNGWSWRRINSLEKAILINACYEFYFEKLSKPIAINESILYAKEFCQSKAFKIINWILDKTLI